MTDTDFNQLYTQALELQKKGDIVGITKLVLRAQRQGLNTSYLSMLSALAEGALQFSLSGPR